MGGILANEFTGIIAEKFIDAAYQFDWLLLLVMMVATALLANIAGRMASARILDQRPIEVFGRANKDAHRVVDVLAPIAGIRDLNKLIWITTCVSYLAIMLQF